MTYLISGGNLLVFSMLCVILQYVFFNSSFSYQVPAEQAQKLPKGLPAKAAALIFEGFILQLIFNRYLTVK